MIPPTSDDYYIFAHALGEAQFWAIVAVRISHTSYIYNVSAS